MILQIEFNSKSLKKEVHSTTENFGLSRGGLTSKLGPGWPQTHRKWAIVVPEMHKSKKLTLGVKEHKNAIFLVTIRPSSCATHSRLTVLLPEAP